MAAWRIRSNRASVVSPGTISRRQIGGSVPISVTLTWYVQGGSSFLLAAALRGMGGHSPADGLLRGARAPHSRTSREAPRPQPPSSSLPIHLSVRERMVLDQDATAGFRIPVCASRHGAGTGARARDLAIRGLMSARWPLGRDHPLDRRNELRQVARHDLPDDVEVHGLVAVDQPVASADHLAPR